MFEPGDRVTLKPNHDAYLNRGERAGTVQFTQKAKGKGARIGDKFYHVLLDKSGTIRRFAEHQIELMERREPNGSWIVHIMKRSVNA